jgi:hypothetical protein
MRAHDCVAVAGRKLPFGETADSVPKKSVLDSWQPEAPRPSGSEGGLGGPEAALERGQRLDQPSDKTPLSMQAILCC